MTPDQPTPELVEKVARALYVESERQATGSSANADWMFRLTDDAHGEDADAKRHADDYRDLARAALSAIPDERGQIVAWLRMKADLHSNRHFRSVADAIEAGHHLQKDAPDGQG